MERQYLPLRPAVARSQHVQESPPEPLEPKRRRVGVAVACNACRRRKVRCDGGRPTCSQCHDQAGRCVYRDETAPDDQALAEVIGVLNALPSAESIRILGSLRGEHNPSRILSVIRGGLVLYQQPLEQPSASGVLNRPFETLELEAQNPVAYPALSPFNPLSFQVEPYRGLTTAADDDTSSLPARSTDHGAPRRTGVAQKRHLVQSQTMFNAEPATHSHGIDPPSLCDERLQNLDIRLWTTVNIDSTTAARCISLYLETDHPLLGHFDPELFLSHLTTGQTEYCSALLVNALLYWASQMYSAVEPQTDDLAMRFCAEAERLWKEECVNDSVVNIAAAQFLSLGYLGHGRDHSVLHYLGQASNMGRRMGLFDSGPAANNPCLTFDGLTVAESRARLYAAWGVFNWTTLMSLFYHQPGLNCPKSPPSLPIPGGEHLDDQQESEFAQAQAVPLLPFMGKTFAFLCQFWRIVREISLVYHQDGTSPVDGHHSLRFAEFKFRELLAWSNGLPSHLLRGDHKPHHVQILHLWFHAAVLELFRPCAQGGLAARRRLRTFTSTSSTPEAVCNASVEQLKHLILNFRLNYKSSTYTILWHTAMIYVANALLHSSKMDGWFSYFLLCVYGYERLRRSWRVTEAIAKGLLAMTLRSGDISNQTARHILQDLERKKVSEMPEPVSAQFPIDLDLALSDPISATAESLAGQFEETILLDDYTHEFDNDNDNDNGESSST